MKLIVEFCPDAVLNLEYNIWELYGLESLPVGIDREEILADFRRSRIKFLYCKFLFFFVGQHFDGYNLSVAYKMSEESRISSCSSEVSDNLNLFSITQIEYGLSLIRSQLNSELLSSGVFFLSTKRLFP